jgi:hypothetical protein
MRPQQSPWCTGDSDSDGDGIGNSIGDGDGNSVGNDDGGGGSSGGSGGGQLVIPCPSSWMVIVSMELAIQMDSRLKWAGVPRS